MSGTYPYGTYVCSGTYAGTALVYALAQVKYTQLDFASNALYMGFIQGTLIPQAQKVIDTYVNHCFGSCLGTFQVDGNSKKTLVLPPMFCPLINVTSVTVNSVDVTSNIKTYNNYLKYDDGTFTADEQNVQIVASFGYRSVPSDVEYVCGALCAGVLREMVRSKRVPDLLVGILETETSTALGAIISNPRVFTKELKELLNKYVYYDYQVG
jgi:hypothetical protein